MPVYILIWVVASFVWLGYESNWMRIKLLVGIPFKPAIPCTREEIIKLRRELFPAPTIRNKWPLGSYIWGGVMEPMCSWEFIRDHKDFNPEFNIELVFPGVRYNMIIQAPAILNKIMKVNRFTKKQLAAL